MEDFISENDTPTPPWYCPKPKDIQMLKYKQKKTISVNMWLLILSKLCTLQRGFQGSQVARSDFKVTASTENEQQSIFLHARNTNNLNSFNPIQHKLHSYDLSNGPPIMVSPHMVQGLTNEGKNNAGLD